MAPRSAASSARRPAAAAAAASKAAASSAVGYEEERFVAVTLAKFKNAGAALATEAERAELSRLDAKAFALSSTIEQNINNFKVSTDHGTRGGKIVVDGVERPHGCS